MGINCQKNFRILSLLISKYKISDSDLVLLIFEFAYFKILMHYWLGFKSRRNFFNIRANSVLNFEYSVKIRGRRRPKKVGSRLRSVTQKRSQSRLRSPVPNYAGLPKLAKKMRNRLHRSLVKTSSETYLLKKTFSGLFKNVTRFL